MSRHQGMYYLHADVGLDLAALHDNPSLLNSSGNSKGALSDVLYQSHNDRRKCPRYCYFYYAIVAAFGSLGFGFTMVYSSSFLEDMSRRTNFTLWTEGFEDCIHQSLVGPLAPIGGVVGGLLSSLVIGLFGLVFSLLTAGVMFVAGWAMIGASWFVSSPAWFRVLILTGRFVTGAATGWVSVTSPIYVAEISPRNSRGTFGVLFPTGIGLGNIVCLVIGHYISYWKLAFLFSGLSVFHVVLLFTIQESPVRVRNIVKNIKQFRDHEYRSVARKSGKFFTKRVALLALMVNILFVLQQLTGINVISFYVGPIFHSIGGEQWPIPPGIAASISIGVTKILTIICIAFFIDRIGRKILLFTGALGMMVANIGIGSYFTLVAGILPTLPAADSHGVNNSSLCFFDSVIANPSIGRQYSSLAIVSIVVFAASFSGGWSLVMYLYAAELFPKETRGVGVGSAIASNWTSGVIVTLLFPVSTHNIGPALSFYILALMAGGAAVFVLFCIPETKGKEMGFNASRKFSPRRNIEELCHSMKMCVYCKLLK